MSDTSARQASAGGISIATALLGGFILAALVDAVLVTIFLRLPTSGLGTRAIQLFISTGHVLAMGLVLSSGCALADRLLTEATRRARATRVVAAFVVAFGLGWFALSDDLSIFGLGVRAIFTLPVAIAFGAIALFGPLVRRIAALRAAWAALGLGAGIANVLLLASNYPGSHLALTALTGVSLGVALLGLPLRLPKIADLAGTLALSFAAAASLVVWPSSVVLMELARHHSASLFPFLAAARAGAVEAQIGSVPAEQREWFVSRDAARPVQPSRLGLIAAGKKPIVILLTIDAFRADLLGRDDAEAATKNLRALAARGARFSQARSTASSTSPALGAMFAGRYYSSLYWADKKQDGKLKPFLAEEDTVRWPALLTGAGVHTTSFSSTEGLEASFGVVVGFSKEVRRVKSSDQAVQKLDAWLDDVGARPGFAFTHVLDAHAPYSRGAKSDPPFRRYLAEIAHVDEAIGDLAAAIEKRNLWERTILIVSADHGEAFGEHGTNYHGASVYEELVRVPLVIVGGGIAPRERDEPVSLMDLGPTVLDIFSLATPGHFMGESLVPLLAGRPHDLTRPIVMDSGRRMQSLVFPDGVKVIRNLRQTSTELYDLKADPLELKNVVDERPDAKGRIAALAAFFATHELKKPGYEVPYRQ